MKDGGPAFQQSAPIIGVYANGMTLRDHFAAKAMQGILAHEGTEDRPEVLALCAYAMADAMISEREKASA